MFINDHIIYIKEILKDVSTLAVAFLLQLLFPFDIVVSSCRGFINNRGV